MTTQTLVKNLTREVQELQRDIVKIKRIVLGIPEDTEGEYKQTYIEKMRKRAESQKPLYAFTTKEAFLKHVREGR